MNKKKVIISVFIILFFVSVIFAIYKKESIKDEIAKKGGYFKDETKVDKNKVLRMGSRGREVVILQETLEDRGEYLGNTGKGKDGIDGWFGKLTLKALQSSYDVSSITLNELEAIKTKEMPVPADQVSDTEMA